MRCTGLQHSELRTYEKDGSAGLPLAIRLACVEQCHMQRRSPLDCNESWSHPCFHLLVGTERGRANARGKMLELLCLHLLHLRDASRVARNHCTDGLLGRSRTASTRLPNGIYSCPIRTKISKRRFFVTKRSETGWEGSMSSSLVAGGLGR